jgi:hypothetical protein
MFGKGRQQMVWGDSWRVDDSVEIGGEQMIVQYWIGGESVIV